MIGFSRSMTKIPEHLAQVQLQRPAFAFDLLHLMPEDFLGLVRLLELRPELALVHVRAVLNRLDLRVRACKLALRGVGPLTGMAKLLPKLLSFSIGALTPLCLASPFRLRLHERLCERIDLRRQKGKLLCQVPVAHRRRGSTFDSISLPVFSTA
jgi:hypothetical protein